MSKVEARTVIFPLIGPISAVVDSEELAKNLKFVGDLAKKRGLRPGETRGIDGSLKMKLREGTYIVGSADKLATLFTILRAKAEKKIID